MGWSVGYDELWKRWIGYGVPAYCDHPGCMKEIDRGLAHVCCGQQPYGGEEGCGLFFCFEHHDGDGKCERCAPLGEEDCSNPFEPSPEHPDWINHLLTDESWEEWRQENPDEVTRLRNYPK